MATIQWLVDGTGPRAVIAGMITGSGDLADLTNHASPPSLTIDAGDIRAFTSSGIQAWLDALRKLRARGLRLVFERCSPAVVRQTMSIEDFLAGGAVRSVVVPYVCPSCDLDASEEVAVGAARSVAPSRSCTCGDDMELDDLPDAYVSLLREAATGTG